MARKIELDTDRFHIVLFKDDVEFLEAEYGKNSAKPVGLSFAVRAIVHAKVEDMRARAAEAYERIARGAKG